MKLTELQFRKTIRLILQELLGVKSKRGTLLQRALGGSGGYGHGGGGGYGGGYYDDYDYYDSYDDYGDDGGDDGDVQIE